MSVVVKRFLCPTAGDPARRSRGSAAAPALEGDGRQRTGAHCAGLSARVSSWSRHVDQLTWRLATGPEGPGPRRPRSVGSDTLRPRRHHCAALENDHCLGVRSDPRRELEMAYVIAEPCIDVLDISCVSVCPVDCIHYDEGADRKLFIDPNECIDCGACEPECPVNAIFPEESLPPEWANYTVIDATWNTDKAAARAAVHGGSSLYTLDEDALAEARPDLIITQELCRVCAVSYREVNDVARGIDADISVVSLEPASIEGILNTITTVGAMAEAEDAAVELVAGLRERLRAIETKAQERREDGFSGPRVVGLEWLDPPFAVGHWVPEQIRRAGGWDLLGSEGERSVETTWEAVRDVDPEMIVLMPCGFHLEDTVAEWARTPRPGFWTQIEAVRRGSVFAVDGSAYFSRPGPRAIDGIAMLAEIFDPNAFVDTSPAGSWTP